mmetsp:Transcript_45694/g.83691  ORF Transcript_45694/g.83691 Transcript_45694/m.83691 type:complete len:201 (-) Transcript_45694:653-1255(-)
MACLEAQALLERQKLLRNVFRWWPVCRAVQLLPHQWGHFCSVSSVAPPPPPAQWCLRLLLKLDSPTSRALRLRPLKQHNASEAPAQPWQRSIDFSPWHSHRRPKPALVDKLRCRNTHQLQAQLPEGPRPPPETCPSCHPLDCSLHCTPSLHLRQPPPQGTDQPAGRAPASSHRSCMPNRLWLNHPVAPVPLNPPVRCMRP